MDRQTQRCPQRPGSSPTSNLTCHAGRLAQMASHRSTFRVLKIKSQPVTTRRRSSFCPHEEVRKLDPKKLKSSLRLHTRLKLAEALPTTLMSIVHRPTWPGSAHTTCHTYPPDRHATGSRRAARTQRPRPHKYTPHPVNHARPK